MKVETKTFTVTVEYKMFEVGEKVVPLTDVLTPGVYTVKECIAPIDEQQEDSILILEGVQYGENGREFRPATPADTN
jgi:hypothetical protein